MKKASEQLSSKKLSSYIKIINIKASVLNKSVCSVNRHLKAFCILFYIFTLKKKGLDNEHVRVSHIHRLHKSHIVFNLHFGSHSWKFSVKIACLSYLVLTINTCYIVIYLQLCAEMQKTSILHHQHHKQLHFILCQYSTSSNLTNFMENIFCVSSKTKSLILFG